MASEQVKQDRQGGVGSNFEFESGSWFHRVVVSGEIPVGALALPWHHQLAHPPRWGRATTWAGACMAPDAVSGTQ